MMISRAVACRSKSLLPSQAFRLASSNSSRDNPADGFNTVTPDEKDATVCVQGLQGKPMHDFSPRDNQALEATTHQFDNSFVQEVQGIDSHGHIGPKDFGTDTIGNGPTDNIHVEAYQHSSNVSLYSVMQSQVPFPYDHASPTHLNMPCGGENLNQKYVSGMLIDAHQQQDATEEYPNGKPPKVSAPGSSSNIANAVISRHYSTGATGGSEGAANLSQKDKLKRAVKEYGSTVVVFHIGISLMSLGGFYLAVKSGLDVVALLEKLGVGESILTSSMATGASTFVIAYAVHKVFAPARIACTLTATPFIVRHLRNKGILKPPQMKN